MGRKCYNNEAFCLLEGLAVILLLGSICGIYRRIWLQVEK